MLTFRLPIALVGLERDALECREAAGSRDAADFSREHNLGPHAE